MNVAFGHTNTDLDCLGSLLLVKKLFPDYRLVRSSRIHPAARNIFGFYSEYFDFINPQDLSKEKIENIIIVDTCSAGRVSEYFGHIKNSEPAIRVFDHHPAELFDIKGARLEGAPFGANTSLMGKMAMEKGIILESEEATIALTAIYADTGRLTHENITRVDYEVSGWLLDMGASIKLVKSFLETIREDNQIAVLDHIKPETLSINGNDILISYLELEENVSGLAAVVDKIMDMLNHDAYFAVFPIPKDNTILLIARSQKDHIDLHKLLVVYGGGGHHLAASAKIIGMDGHGFFDEFKLYLEQALIPAARARDIMSENVFTVRETTSLLNAAMYLEELNHTTITVVDKDDNVTGIISLFDIMKGRKHGKMQAPVKAYMSTPVISAQSMSTIREIERLFNNEKIVYLPILENRKLLGIVTRWDFLQFQKKTSAPGE